MTRQLPAAKPAGRARSGAAWRPARSRARSRSPRSLASRSSPAALTRLMIPLLAMPRPGAGRFPLSFAGTAVRGRRWKGARSGPGPDPSGRASGQDGTTPDRTRGRLPGRVLDDGRATEIVTTASVSATSRANRQGDIRGHRSPETSACAGGTYEATQRERTGERTAAHDALRFRPTGALPPDMRCRASSAASTSARLTP